MEEVMQEEMQVNVDDLVSVDGEIMTREEAMVSMEDRGYNFGDGVFELVPVFNGKAFALIPHMENLIESLIKLKIPGVYTVEELVELHEDLLRATGKKDCYIYTQITRGASPFGLAYPTMSIPRLTMFCLPMDKEDLAAKRETGVTVFTDKDVRGEMCDINTLNRLPEVLAKQKAVIARVFDTLMVRDNKITEGTEGAFFIYREDVLWTHPDNNHIHKNITRRLLKERICPDKDLTIVERAFTKDFAIAADEAFLVSPTVGIMPVTKIDRTKINEGKVGPMCKELQEAYEAFVKRECGKC